MAENKSKPKVIEKPEVKASEEVKQPIEKLVEQSGLPKFINNTEKDIKIRLGGRKKPNWITIKVGQVVEISRKLAKANRLQEVK